MAGPVEDAGERFGDQSRGEVGNPGHVDIRRQGNGAVHVETVERLPFIHGLGEGDEVSGRRNAGDDAAGGPGLRQGKGGLLARDRLEGHGRAPVTARLVGGEPEFDGNRIRGAVAPGRGELDPALVRRQAPGIHGLHLDGMHGDVGGDAHRRRNDFRRGGRHRRLLPAGGQQQHACNKSIHI